MIQFNDITKTYDKQPVLYIRSLNLERGIYWLQGMNGSGKTTLLRMLAGLIPFEGEIRVGNIDLIKDPLCYRRIVNFAEAEPLYPDFITGSELVNFYKETRNSSADQADMLVYLFKMQHYILMPVKTYSSGMIKKLSLLLAFIGKPLLMLLDEPLATLDEEAIRILPGLISAYSTEFKTCFIFSSHQSFKPGPLKITKILISDQSLQLIA
jgi:ABC-2 type transport system ATP-binding protein